MKGYFQFGSGTLMDQSTPGEGSQRPPLRNLETQTTIPLGHVDEAGFDEALSAKYNQPLWKCLFADNPNKEVEVDSLILPTCAWLDARQDQNDIEQVDPEMKHAVEKAMKLKQVACEKESEMKHQRWWTCQIPGQDCSCSWSYDSATAEEGEGFGGVKGLQKSPHFSKWTRTTFRSGKPTKAKLLKRDINVQLMLPVLLMKKWGNISGAWLKLRLMNEFIARRWHRRWVLTQIFLKNWRLSWNLDLWLLLDLFIWVSAVGYMGVLDIDTDW